MNDERPRVFSRSAITIVSLVVALPLAVWPWLYFPADHGVGRFLHGVGIDMLVTRFATTPALLLALVVFETLFRWNRFPTRYRWPWFSFFLMPGLFLASLITDAVLIAGWTLFPPAWTVATLLLFQIVGHASLPARTDSAES